jgi:hypothetical protein
MIPFGDPARAVDPFDISCSAAGKGRWVDATNWVFDFDQDLPAGVKCVFSLKAGLKTLVPDGVITAGNASQICDGASAVLIASEAAVKEHRLKPLARIDQLTVTAGARVIMLDEPIRATRTALEKSGVPYTISPGDGAFYGPKIEYSLKDGIGRVWQCGTMQVDFSMPGRLGAEYVGEDNTRHTPVMLHRAIVGSMERFTGILIEHHAGAFPLWLAPVQAVVLNITDRQADYARQVADRLRSARFRVAVDTSNEKIGYKIREHSLQKLPYQLVVGDKEMQAHAVAVRTRTGEDLGAMPLDALIERMQSENRPGA